MNKTFLKHRLPKILDIFCDGGTTFGISGHLVGWNAWDLIGISQILLIRISTESSENYKIPPESHQNLQNLIHVPSRILSESLESFIVLLEYFIKFGIFGISCQKNQLIQPSFSNTHFIFHKNHLNFFEPRENRRFEPQNIRTLGEMFLGETRGDTGGTVLRYLIFVPINGNKPLGPNPQFLIPSVYQVAASSAAQSPKHWNNL